MSSKSAAVTNSFLVLNAPTKKVQDYKQMKPTGAVSWLWDHFSAVRDNQYQFNLLALLARRILCIPSTSAPLESVFSTAGHTITKLRASLNSANAADLIFLHDSGPVAEVYEAEKDKKRKR